MRRNQKPARQDVESLWGDGVVRLDPPPYSYDSFPAEAPTYPVLWGDITGNPEEEVRKRYPFGDVMCIPRQASLGD
jgi:hypothetical protein